MLLAIIFKHAQIPEDYYKTLRLFHNGVLTPSLKTLNLFPLFQKELFDL